MKREKAEQLAAHFQDIPGCFSSVDIVGTTHVVVVCAYYPTEIDHILRCFASLRQAEAFLEELRMAAR